jgi:hypothetical protein
VWAREACRQAVRRPRSVERPRFTNPVGRKRGTDLASVPFLRSNASKRFQDESARPIGADSLATGEPPCTPVAPAGALRSKPVLLSDPQRAPLHALVSPPKNASPVDPSTTSGLNPRARVRARRTRGPAMRSMRAVGVRGANPPLTDQLDGCADAGCRAQYRFVATSDRARLHQSRFTCQHLSRSFRPNAGQPQVGPTTLLPPRSRISAEAG